MTDHNDQRTVDALKDAQLKGLPVAGYKPQDQATVDIVNSFKQDEERILRKLDAMRYSRDYEANWLHEGRLQLQQAFMLINRSVFQPDRVRLPEDDDLNPNQIGGINAYKKTMVGLDWGKADTGLIDTSEDQLREDGWLGDLPSPNGTALTVREGGWDFTDFTKKVRSTARLTARLFAPSGGKLPGTAFPGDFNFARYQKD